MKPYNETVMSSFKVSQITGPSTFHGRALWNVAIWITLKTSFFMSTFVDLSLSVNAIREVWISSRHGPLDGGLLRLNRPGPSDELGCRGKDRSFAMFRQWEDLCCSINPLFQTPYHLECLYFCDVGMGCLCQSVSPPSEDLWSVLKGKHTAMHTYYKGNTQVGFQGVASQGGSATCYITCGSSFFTAQMGFSQSWSMLVIPRRTSFSVFWGIYSYLKASMGH